MTEHRLVSLMKHYSGLLTSSLLLCICWPLHTVELRLHGTLIENPPCTLNDNQSLMIEFGDALSVKKIDGVNYLQRKAIPVKCTEAPGAALQVRLTGTASGFDSSALLSSVSALGIRFYLASKPLAVNSTLPIVFPGTLDLGAVPVQQPGVTLEGGDFTASAALLLEYQ